MFRAHFNIFLLAWQCRESCCITRACQELKQLKFYRCGLHRKRCTEALTPKTWKGDLIWKFFADVIKLRWDHQGEPLIPYDWHPHKKRRKDADPQGKHHVGKEAETGVMLPQSKNTKDYHRHGADSLSETPKKESTLPTAWVQTSSH